jgi:hypothetical protein
MFVCLFVCMELIQIHISEPISTKLCTHLPLGLEEVVGYVRLTIFQLSHIFDLFCRERVPIRAQEMATGATFLRYCVISVMRRVFV